MRKTFAAMPTVALAVAVLAMGTVAGQERSDGTTGADAGFVKQASAAGLAEVQLGQLASAQGRSAQVRQYGAQMVKDHTAADQALSSIASGKGLPLAKAAMPADQAATEQLQAAQGAAFDQAYGRKMVADHRKALQLFQQEANDGKDPQLQAFAEKTLPVIREHLAMAQALDRGGNAPVSH